MQIGVVSDTHGHHGNARAAARMLESCGVEAVLHCGDIGTTQIVEVFRPWPTHFVFGNVDDQPAELRAAIAAAGLHCHERFGVLELAGRKIAFLHGDDGRRLDETVASGEYQLVCYGHTHRPEFHQAERTLVLNPGALYRAQPHTLALVDLADMTVTHIPL